MRLFLNMQRNEGSWSSQNHRRSRGKDYKRQDLDGSSSSHWGWLSAYATRFPNHENIQRLKQWSSK